MSTADTSAASGGACAVPSGKRQKTPHAVVAFDTTSDAMAMEAASKAHDIPGRIIPVPREISAGCGMAWAVRCCQRDQVEQALRAHKLAYDDIYIVDLY